MPSRVVTAWPVSSTRSPTTRVRTTPDRAEACRPTSSSRPSRADHSAASAVCALPVTGSSGMPTAGAKNRETKSNPSDPAAVTATPRRVSAARRVKSGRRAAHVGDLHDDVVQRAGVVHGDERCAERLGQPLRGGDRDDRGDREVERDRAVVGGLGGEDPGPRGEADAALEQAVAAQRVRGGEGGVPAQAHLDGGGEPTQPPLGVGPGLRAGERRLGQVHLQCHLLHPGLVRPARPVEDADGGRVACEGPVGEGVDDSDPHADDARAVRRGGTGPPAARRPHTGQATPSPSGSRPDR